MRELACTPMWPCLTRVQGIAAEAYHATSASLQLCCSLQSAGGNTVQSGMVGDLLANLQAFGSAAETVRTGRAAVSELAGPSGSQKDRAYAS